MQTKLSNAIKVVEDKDQIYICLKRFTSRRMFQVIFMTVISFTFLPMYIQGALSAGAWFFLPLVIPFFIYVFYVLLTKMVNSTCIGISNDVIHVTQGPLPYVGNKNLPLTQFRILKINEKENQGRTRRTHYNLVAFTNFGSDMLLISEIDKIEQAEFIKLRLEKYLEQINK